MSKPTMCHLESWFTHSDMYPHIPHLAGKHKRAHTHTRAQIHSES